MTHIGATFDLVGDGNHLRIIISNPNQNGDVLVCNITDAKHDSECKCVFLPSDHPRIIKPSIIAVRKLAILSAAKFSDAAAMRTVVFREDCSATMLAKVVEFISNHPDVAPKYKTFLGV